MATQQLEFDGIIIEVHHKRIKHLNLRIYPPDGQVRVSAPLKFSMKQIRMLIEEKGEWIHSQRARIKAQPLAPVLTMQAGENHFFLGTPYPLKVNIQHKKPCLAFLNNEFILTITSSTTACEKKAVFDAWYRQQMSARLPCLIKKWEHVIGVDVREWGVRAMKTRWGSCNIRARRIWLNLSLIQKPLDCLESVLVHEMIHLLEASHNARFYALMDRFMPDWRIAQAPLKMR